jgi:hypothetical protein
MGNTIENFKVVTSSKGLPADIIFEEGLRVSEILELKKEMSLTLEEASILRKISGIDSVNRSINTIKISNETFFPNKITYNWNEDNFGPIVIPKKRSESRIKSKKYFSLQKNYK